MCIHYENGYRQVNIYIHTYRQWWIKYRDGKMYTVMRKQLINRR